MAVGLWWWHSCSPAGDAVTADDAAPPPSREQIEVDWLRQNAVHGTGSIAPAEDAVGACDGVKDGKWGFHTALEDDPWWQIDLGASLSLERLVIYNRCDHTAGRAAQLAVLLSDDGDNFELAYRHDGTLFLGQPDGKPLEVKLAGKSARYVRLQVPGNNCLHLDEVEIFPIGKSQNVALGRPATQSSVCEWSTRKGTAHLSSYSVDRVVQQGLRLAASLERLAVAKPDSPTEQASRASCTAALSTLQQVQASMGQLAAGSSESQWRDLYLRACWAVRQLALANPLLDFDDLVIVRGAPGKWSHMSDQYLGWWSQPGGGLYILHDFKTDHASLQCLTESFPSGNVFARTSPTTGKRYSLPGAGTTPGSASGPTSWTSHGFPKTRSTICLK